MTKMKKQKQQELKTHIEYSLAWMGIFIATLIISWLISLKNNDFEKCFLNFSICLFVGQILMLLINWIRINKNGNGIAIVWGEK